MRVAGITILVAILLATPGHGGEVELSNGQRMGGELRIEGGRLLIQPDGGAAKAVDLSALRRARFANGHAASPARVPPVPDHANSPVLGLRGEYYADREMTDLRLVRVDGRIDFSYPSELTPDPLVPKGYTVRWTGQIRPLYSETYTFTVESNAGARLWVGDTLLIDRMPGAPGVYGETIPLLSGRTYDVRLEYRDNPYDARIVLAWSSRRQEYGVIDARQLSPPEGTQPPTGVITSPRDESLFVTPREVRVSVDAADRDGEVRTVRLFVNGKLVDTARQAPWNLVWRDPVPGYHTLHARITDSQNITASTPETHIAVAADCSHLPKGWVFMPVGEPEPQGIARQADGMLVEACKASLWGERESFMFMFRPLPEDGQIVARLQSMEGPDETFGVSAGLMLRRDLAPGASPFAFLGINPEVGLVYARRQSGEGERHGVEQALVTPCYLKLTRRGQDVGAYYSADGKAWQSLGMRRVELEGEAFIGLAVACPDARSARGVFTEVQVTSAAAANAWPDAGVVLRGGSFLPGRPLRIANDKLIVEGRSQAIPLAQVAAVALRPVSVEQRQAATGRAGVLLANGDFLDGALAEMDGESATVESVLFGRRRFDPRADAVLIALRELKGTGNGWEIRCADGVIVHCPQPSIEGDELVATDGSGVAFRLKAGDIVEIRRGG